MNADEKRKVFEELLERYQDYIESEFSYEDGEREAERKAWLNRYYGIKEPLIKDEKIRNVVRAWAEMHGVKRVHYLVYAHNSKLAYIEDVEGDSESAWAEMDIISLPELKDLECYTIAELCGEEEE